MSAYTIGFISGLIACLLGIHYAVQTKDLHNRLFFQGLGKVIAGVIMSVGAVWLVFNRTNIYFFAAPVLLLIFFCGQSFAFRQILKLLNNP